MRFRPSKYRRAVRVFLFVLLICIIFILFTYKYSRQDDCINFLQRYSTRKLIPFHMFHYPLDIDFKKLEEDITYKGSADVDPINEFQFSYKKSIDHICDSSEGVFLLFMFKSAPWNFDQRQAIRETWANQTYFENDIIRHVFLIGRTMNETIYDRLSLEEEMHHDILEMTYVDDYYNSTYKIIGGINWCVRYCPTAQFVMLVDDDLYVATDYVIKYLHGLPKNIYRTLFVGRVLLTAPQRCLNDKWFISLKDYPFDTYPLFVSGGAVIMSMDFVKRLQIVIPFTKWFKFDDVFLGIIAYQLGVQPIHHPEFYIADGVSYKEEKFKTALVSHGYRNINKLKTAWYLHMQTNDSV
ncbi:beta-1,3-galactosyltransferase brn-like [Pecten maximus]|uniref:beta-1,3-galactosyltransferase brn-like n=1 Tax=Pecten maximus TaxID=6579 RepID=UPI00145885FB|nr:beta-1,3-galactosyltransferase brn-like [Pecten maximus]